MIVLTGKERLRFRCWLDEVKQARAAVVRRRRRMAGTSPGTSTMEELVSVAMEDSRRAFLDWLINTLDKGVEHELDERGEDSPVGCGGCASEGGGGDDGGGL